jgi:hypothetical protein
MEVNMLTDHVEARIVRQVDALFEADRKSHYGQWHEIPILGGHYVPGEDDIENLKELVCLALSARDWFAKNGPADAQPLPLAFHEQSIRGGRGLLRYIVALYAWSLASRNYDVVQHPPFADYVSGVLWEAERIDSGIGALPAYPDQLPELKKLYPPRELAGMRPGFCWQPPKLCAREMETRTARPIFLAANHA